MEITRKKNQQLKNQAHHLKPVIMMGAKGLTEAVHKEIEAALTAHELIKIKIHEHDKADIAEMTRQFATVHGAHHVQTVGHTVTLWRQRKDR